MTAKEKAPRLNTIGGVRRELARVYTDARANQLDINVAYKLVAMLSALGKMIEASELEPEIDELIERLEATEQTQVTR